MKYHIFPIYIISLAGLFATNQKGPTKINEPLITSTDSSAIASKLLTLTDAKKIMGEPAKLTGNAFTKKGDTLEYTCEYTALAQDAITSKTGKLYFMYEKYKGVAAAANAYRAIYQANSRNQGVEMVSGLGSEAYYHTDHTGFYFFLVHPASFNICLSFPPRRLTVG